MEEERTLIPANDDKAAVPYNDICFTFSTNYFSGRSIFSFAGRPNMVEHAINNSRESNSRVNKILKEQTLEVDSIDNMNLFGLNLN